ncbi:MAG: putative zinc-binding metallopeptidase [Elusimicrobiota bacterium]
MDLNNLNDNELLELRFCDLNLKIEDTWLKECIEQLYEELKDNGIKFKPSCYLADEWLTPDGEPVIGIAFYLAHPRLMKLEHKMIKDIEGGERAACMKLLRHEAGHAINYAYLLHRRRKWREFFGPFSADYPARYKYHPYSKNYVRHLDNYYAQYHPDEDFAETFAVWLASGSDWRKQYTGWNALNKLEYIDKLMHEIAPKSPKIKRGRKYWSIDKSKMTLRTYYKRKRDLYADAYPDYHDFTLLRIFPEEDTKANKDVGKIIRKYRPEILDNIALLTGEKKYVINDIIKKILQRCRELNIRSSSKEGEIIHLITAYITTLTMNYYYTASFKKGK